MAAARIVEERGECVAQWAAPLADKRWGGGSHHPGRSDRGIEMTPATRDIDALMPTNSIPLVYREFGDAWPRIAPTRNTGRNSVGTSTDRIREAASGRTDPRRLTLCLSQSPPNSATAHARLPGFAGRRRFGSGPPGRRPYECFERGRVDVHTERRHCQRLAVEEHETK